MNLMGRNFLKDTDVSPAEYAQLLELAAALRRQKENGHERQHLVGRNIALIFEKTSTRTRAAFTVAAQDQGGQATYLGPGETQLGVKESVEDTARVLGRMFDGIEFRGFFQADVEALAYHAGVPVWNGLTDEWHPTQSLADLRTMLDHANRPLSEVSVCFLGDGANNTCASLLTAGAMMGMDVRIAAPIERRPRPGVWDEAVRLAEHSGGSVMATADPRQAVEGVDFLYTDVWLSLGEPPDRWDERIDLLLPYQVNAALVAATANPEVKLLHCLPAFHNRRTTIGEQILRAQGARSPGSHRRRL